MKKILGLILVLTLILTCGAALAEEEAPSSGMQKDLVVFYTSDVHCGVDTGWGYAGLYEIKQSLSKDYNVLLVDDGDAIQGEPIGTMTTGESLIDLMNATGYDVAIPGNHEFDYGMDRFLELAEKANYPYISCNFNKEGELVFKPYVIREFDGVKIAFVGVTTPMTLRTSTPKYFMNDEGEFIYGFFQDEDGSALYAAVQKAVDDARAEGANYVILMAHLGNESECSPWMYNQVIENTTGIDAILDGHSHDTDQVVLKNKDGEDVVRSACGTKFEAVGALWIKSDGSVSSELFSWDSSISAPDLLGLQNEVSEVLAVETDELNQALATVVAKTSVDLIINDPEATTEDGKPVRIIRNAETNLGDLCADAYLDQAGDADIAFVNGGGIRVSINKGDITLNDILKVHPFGNSLTVIEVTGQQVLDALEWSVHALPGEFGGFNHVAGMTYEVDVTIPTPCQEENTMFNGIDDSMERRVRNVLIGGEPLDPEKTYKLASHNYQLLDYGDGYTMYDGSPVLQESVKLDNQVLIDYITDTLGGIVGDGYTDPYGQGRMVAVGEEG